MQTKHPQDSTAAELKKKDFLNFFLG